MIRPRLTVVTSHVRRLPERSPEYIATHERLFNEVNDHMTQLLCAAMELELAGLTAAERARIEETY